jgi:hypothetical protein
VHRRGRDRRGAEPDRDPRLRRDQRADPINAAALLVWNWESGLKGGDIHGFGDSLFFATVQVLTVSSSIKNPLTGADKVVDVILELWAIVVVTAMAGSFSSFFSSGDS